MAVTKCRSWEGFKTAAAENPGYIFEIVNKGSYFKPDLFYKISTSNGAFVLNRNLQPMDLEGSEITNKSSLIVLDVLQLSKNAKYVYIDKELFKFGNSLYSYLLADRKPLSLSNSTLVGYSRDSIRKHFDARYIKDSMLNDIEKSKRIHGPFMKSLVDYYWFNNADDKIKKSFPWRFESKDTKTDDALEAQIKDNACQASTKPKQDRFAFYDNAVDYAYSFLEKLGGFILGLIKSDKNDTYTTKMDHTKQAIADQNETGSADIAEAAESEQKKDLEAITAESWDRSKYEITADGTLIPKPKIDVRV